MSARTALRPPHWAGLALAAAVILVGCSDPEQPGTMPPATSTPTPTTSTPSPTPTSAKQQVEAAVRTYYAELKRAGQTNDTSRLKTMIDKGCPCYNAVTVIEGHASRGETTRQIRFSLDSVRVHDITGKLAAAEVRYSVNDYDVLDAQGEKVAHIRAQQGHFDLSLVQTDEGWIVASLFDLEGS